VQPRKIASSLPGFGTAFVVSLVIPTSFLEGATDGITAYLHETHPRKLLVSGNFGTIV
jgi:hypothetical protein